MKEEWRDIKGYEDYQVSNLGRVKSFKRNKIRILQPCCARGLQRIGLRKYGVLRPFPVARLVAEAFVPNPEGKPLAVHLDNNLRNNCASNLCWMTRAEHNRHVYDLGLNKVGENRRDAKLTNEQARYIKENPDGLKDVELAKKFDVSSQLINRVHRGKTYRRALGNV